LPDRKNGINLIPSRYHWDQLDAKLIVLDINFPVRCLKTTIYNCIFAFKGTNGKVNILDIQPQTIHDRTQVFLGAKEELQELHSYLNSPI
jgi:hypothetical protein